MFTLPNLIFILNTYRVLLSLYHLKVFCFEIFLRQSFIFLILSLSKKQKTKKKCLEAMGGTTESTVLKYNVICFATDYILVLFRQLETMVVTKSTCFNASEHILLLTSTTSWIDYLNMWCYKCHNHQRSNPHRVLLSLVWFTSCNSYMGFLCLVYPCSTLALFFCVFCLLPDDASGFLCMHLFVPVLTITCLGTVLNKLLVNPQLCCPASLCYNKLEIVLLFWIYHKH